MRPYIVVSDEWRAGLQDKVERFMDMGYVPTGGVAFLRNSIYQAMYLPEHTSKLGVDVGGTKKNTVAR